MEITKPQCPYTLKQLDHISGLSSESPEMIALRRHARNCPTCSLYLGELSDDPMTPTLN